MKITRIPLQICLLGMVLLAAPGLQAQFLLATNSGTITVVQYTNSGAVVVIPDSTNGLPVTSIGNNAFAGTAVISVSIPGTITNIGAQAFFFCFSLTNVTIPDGVTSIGNDAFSGTSLSTVNVPSSVTNIGQVPFLSSNLVAIIVNTNNPDYSSAAGVLFNKAQTTLIQYPGGLSGSYSISGTVTNIEAYAFEKCFGLTDVTIPTSLTSIGDGVFEQCISLTNVSIGNNVTTIGGGAFRACNGLTSVTIPQSVTTIDDFAFSICTNLTNITIGGGVSTIAQDAFIGCTRLSNVTIPASVMSIGDFAFYSCSNLSAVYFGGNPPSLGSSVFTNDAANVTAYYLPSTTGWDTFSANTDLPSMPWLPQVQTVAISFDIQSNQFGFNVNWASGQTVVVEACTNPAHPVWQRLQTNTLTNGLFYFNDSQWTNYPGRYYRIVAP